jgi:hypothetical protein
MWAAIASTLIGIWLTVAPAIFGYDGAARTNGHVVGPLVATFGAIAISQVTRAARFVNLALAVWLAAAPVVLGLTLLQTIHHAGLALVLGGLSLFPRPDRRKQGGGWTVLGRAGK